MSKPTAAKGSFPYHHRTVEEVDIDTGEVSARIAALDSMSRRRALTEPESRTLERLLRLEAA